MLRKLLLFLGIADKARASVLMPQRVDIADLKSTTSVTNHTEIPVYEQEKRITTDTGIKGNAVDSIETIKQVTGKREIANLTEPAENYREYHLEKTGNPHVLKVQEYNILRRDGSTETVSISGDAFVIHHEHRMLRIGEGCFVKYIQQEYNPITNLTENAYD